ncbi:short-chain dehydrogenase/reductase SDR [Naviculisporaceae sp. PSN 640]
MAPRSFTAETTASQLVADPEIASRIKGKVILTTGPSPNSLGEAFLKTIAKASPALLILAGRDTAKLEQTAQSIRSENPNVSTRLLELNLASLAQVRSAADVVLHEWTDVGHIDVVVNNAGIMAVPFRLTEDRYESQFATNHLGHFLFTNLIMPKILKSEAPRVVNIASDAHRFSPIRWGDIHFNRDESGKYYNKFRSYGQSKTANMLYTLSLAEKLGERGLQAYSVHPGVIHTNLDSAIEDWEVDMPGLMDVDRTMGNESGWEGFKFKSHDQGVATHVYAAFEGTLGEKNGWYLLDAHVADPLTEEYYPWARDSVSAEKLWRLSEELVGRRFEF